MSDLKKLMVLEDTLALGSYVTLSNADDPEKFAEFAQLMDKCWRQYEALHGFLNAEGHRL